MSDLERVAKELGKLRAELDTVDNELVELLNKRMNICKQVGELKKSVDALQVFDPERELAVVKRLSERANYPAMVESLWPHIMLYSKWVQAQVNPQLKISN